MLEGMQMGTVEMGIISSGPISGFVPEYALLDLGYLFDSNEIAQKVLNGPVVEQLNKKMIDAGFRRLAVLDMGYRNVYAKKPITKPEDLKGLKIRTLQTPAQVNTFKALGASPVPMGYSELYTALQQGVVDAAENVPDAYLDSKHYEVAKEYSETKHYYLIMQYLISEKFYQQLPPDLQEIVAQTAKEAAEYENGLIKDLQAKVYEQLQEKGVHINKIDDLTPFIELAKQSWLESAKDVPNGEELLKKILKEAGKTLD
jgi:tripartite ATP-independent transporter DctP family solute receptor